MWKKKKVINLTDEIKVGKQQLPHLPEEIIEEILKRLPVESLVRCSCTCKQLRSLIFCNSKFSKAHIHHAKRHLWKTLKEGSFIQNEEHLRTTIDCDCNIVTSPIPTLSTYLHYPIIVLGSCNSLLFITGRGVSKESKQEFVLLNPYTNSIKRFDSFEVQARKYSTYEYLISGLTYDGASDDYKVIVMLKDRRRSIYVYSLRKSSWKKLYDSIIYWANSFSYKFLGITLDNGFCYWKITRRRVSSVVCFDPVVEKFREVPNFLEELRDTTERRPLRLGTVDGCISLIDRNGVWVMKEYGCWTKLHLLPLSACYQINGFQPLGYNSSKEKLVLQGGGSIRILKVKKGVVRKPRNHRQLGPIYVDINTLYTVVSMVKLIVK